MVSYEIDEVTVTDGTVIDVAPNDKILGISSDATKIIILRKVAKR